MHKAILANRPDLIVAHTTIAGLYARAAALATRYRRRVLVVAHSASDDYRDRRLLAAEVSVSLASPAIWLCVSQEGERWLRRRPIRGRATAHVVLNPVAKRFGELPRTPNPGEILMLGRVVEQKDVLTAIAVVGRVVERGCDVRLRIAGSLEDEEYVTRVRTAVTTRSLEAHVELLGVRSDIPELLGSAAALLHPAVREAASQTLREAWVGGVPIVASEAAIAGVPEIAAAAVFPAGDVDRAADALVAVLRSQSTPIRPSAVDYSPTQVARRYIEHWLANSESPGE
jgi:glycosyltransferase involved in cell wall biosynthesis